MEEDREGDLVDASIVRLETNNESSGRKGEAEGALPRIPRLSLDKGVKRKDIERRALGEHGHVVQVFGAGPSCAFLGDLYVRRAKELCRSE